MMIKRLLPFALSSALLLSACSNSEQVALENYLEEGEEISMHMNEAGTQLETLMNLQGNMMAWSQAEKDELQRVLDAFRHMTEQAGEMTPPLILVDVHPLLIEALHEMHEAVDAIATVANDPSKANDTIATEIETHATKGEELANEYGEKLEEAINAEYGE